MSLRLSVYALLQFFSIDTMYWPVCRSECETVQNKCGIIPNLNCSRFKENTYECARMLSTVCFTLSLHDRLNFKFHSRIMMNLSFSSIFSLPSSPSVSFHGGWYSLSTTTHKAHPCIPSSQSSSACILHSPLPSLTHSSRTLLTRQSTTTSPPTGAWEPSSRA